LGGRKGIRPIKTKWLGAGVVICLERCADLHADQLLPLPLPLTVSCYGKIQIGFTVMVPAHPGSPGKRAVKRVRACVRARARARTHARTHAFNGPFSGTTRVSRYHNGKTNLDFTVARDSEWQWQWQQLVRMQVCTSLQTDNHASTQPLSFYRPDALPATQPTAPKK